MRDEQSWPGRWNCGLAPEISPYGTYEQMEKETENDPNTQVVLVSVEDLASLRKAYPNYYVDTSGFIAAVEAEIGKGNVQAERQFPLPLERADGLKQWPGAPGRVRTLRS